MSFFGARGPCPAYAAELERFQKTPEYLALNAAQTDLVNNQANAARAPSCSVGTEKTKQKLPTQKLKDLFPPLK